MTNPQNQPKANQDSEQLVAVWTEQYRQWEAGENVSPSISDLVRSAETIDERFLPWTGSLEDFLDNLSEIGKSLDEMATEAVARYLPLEALIDNTVERYLTIVEANDSAEAVLVAIGNGNASEIADELDETAGDPVAEGDARPDWIVDEYVSLDEWMIELRDRAVGIVEQRLVATLDFDTAERLGYDGTGRTWNGTEWTA